MFGERTAARALRPPKKVPWAPPSYLSWRVTYKNWGANPAPPGKPYYGPKWPADNPWTYLATDQYFGTKPYKHGTPEPADEKEWQDAIKQVQYTRAGRMHAHRFMHATKARAGVEVPSAYQQWWDKRTKPSYDITKPLQVQLKQRRDANDAWRQQELERKGEAPPQQLWDEGNDPHMSPTPVRRDYADGSKHSSVVRMHATRMWRAMSPDQSYRVPVDRVRLAGQRRAAHRPSAAAAAHTTSVSGAGGIVGGHRTVAPPTELPLAGDDLDEWLEINGEGGSISFDQFLTLFTLHKGTYYKLAGHDVPGDVETTSSSVFPLGMSHTGITSYSTRGGWAHG